MSQVERYRNLYMNYLFPFRCELHVDKIREHYSTISDLTTSSRTQYDRPLTPLHKHTAWQSGPFSTPTTHHTGRSFDDMTFSDSFLTTRLPQHESTPLDASTLTSRHPDESGKKIQELEAHIQELRAGMLAMMNHINSANKTTTGSTSGKWIPKICSSSNANYTRPLLML